MSPSVWEQYGPSTTVVMSMTRMPRSGPVGCVTTVSLSLSAGSILGTQRLGNLRVVVPTERPFTTRSPRQPAIGGSLEVSSGVLLQLPLTGQKQQHDACDQRPRGYCQKPYGETAGV